MPVYVYECPDGHEYDAILPVSRYQEKTKCPKHGKVGKKLIVTGQREPTFSDKIYPYFDTGLNVVFDNKRARDQYMKEKGLKETGGSKTTAKQERYLYNLRRWGQNARYAERRR